MKSGFVSIIGRPNVGKSTFLNSALGEKIAIATDKPQTTRNTIKGIYTDDDAQIIFIDTPGIHKAKTKLGTYMTGQAMNTFEEVDLILFLVDDSKKIGPGDQFIVDALRETKTPKILLINKTDLQDVEEYANIFKQYDELGIFDKIIGTAAIEGRNVDVTLKEIKSHLSEGPMYFPKDAITDHPMRFIVSEIIREKLLMYLEEEVPHGVAVEIEKYQEKEDITNISAIIYCERKSHKGIIIGKGGRKLKGVGTSARKDIEGLIGTKVFLETFVKVKEKWRDSDHALSNFGYKE